MVSDGLRMGVQHAYSTAAVADEHRRVQETLKLEHQLAGEANEAAHQSELEIRQYELYAELERLRVEGEAEIRRFAEDVERLQLIHQQALDKIRAQRQGLMDQHSLSYEYEDGFDQSSPEYVVVDE